MKGTPPSIKDSSGFGLFAMVQLACLLLVSLVGLWWGMLLSRQHGHLQKLNKKVDDPVDLGALGDNFESMVFWEGSFFILVVALTLIMSGLLYWREVKRIKSMEIFFASMTHELKTPLASIRLQTEAIQESLEPAHKGQKWVGRLLQDVSRLEHQVGNTLELARLTGGGDLFIEQVSLQGAVSDLERVWQPHFEKQLDLQLNKITGSAHADRHALNMILNNIFANAIKHSGKSPVQVQVQTVESASGLTLEIKDDGQGCDETALSEVTELFKRGSSTSGTGVGLFLVHSLMGKMNGTARFHNDHGFVVTLHFNGEVGT
jgi:signal transduction histidine kinase